MRKAILALALALSAAAAQPSPTLHPPRLVVVISIDQFRYDYLERFAPWFAARGFNRFLVSGADFTNANYLHATTFTGPGHASIGTGHTPSESGIIANTWFERDAAHDDRMWDWFFDDSPGFTPASKPAHPANATPWWIAGGGSPRYCAYDDRVRVTAGTTSGMSPLSLSSDSLGDRVKEHYPNAHVIGVALKDRAAILMGGRKADAAYWFDTKLPGFISSTYYRFDQALFSFNDRVMTYVPESKQWTLSSTIPDADLKRVTFDPPEAWKMKTPRYETTFPHPVKDARALTYTPFANDMLLDFAAAIVDREKLGADDEPDVLYVGVSTPDYIGHYYGPDSMEVADDAVRLDRSLERFLDALEKKVGSQSLLVAITADHGVTAMPEIARLRDPKLDAGRTDLRNARRDAYAISELPQLRVELERRLSAKLKVPFNADGPLTDALIYFFEEPALYLNWPRLQALNLDGETVKRALRDVIVSMRDSGFDRAFTNSELLAGNAKADPIEQAMRASFRADRSGDVLITLKEHWIWRYSDTNATHGQPLPDDRHVPLLLWGAAIVPGRYAGAAAPTDLARTIGTIVGVDAGGSYARVLPAVKDDVRVLEAVRHELPPLILVAPSDEIAKTLPEGYGRLDILEVKGYTAEVQITTGPLPPPPPPGTILLGCGVRHAFTLQKNDAGEWVVVSRSISEC
jgi:type I phosphodiesterase/nucleotide pyrophosphatase